MTAPHERYRRYLEALTPETLGQLFEQVTRDVRFKDPFNDVRGAGAMARVILHMFDNVPDVTFTINHAAMDGDTCLMEWHFQGTLRGRAWSFNGVSAVRFDPDGRVAEHIDYWDAAEHFYRRLPLIGWLLSWVRRRLAIR